MEKKELRLTEKRQLLSKLDRKKELKNLWNDKFVHFCLTINKNWLLFGLIRRFGNSKILLEIIRECQKGSRF